MTETTCMNCLSLAGEDPIAADLRSKDEPVFGSDGETYMWMPKAGPINEDGESVEWHLYNILDLLALALMDMMGGELPPRGE